MLRQYFQEMNFQEFWMTGTANPGITQDLRVATEQAAGYRLPEAYISLLETHNGGTPAKCIFPVELAGSSVADCVKITHICGLDGTNSGVVAGNPVHGVVVCYAMEDAGNVVMLDYEACGAQGEPQVVYVARHSAHKPQVTKLAADFELFLLGLLDEDEWNDGDDEDDYDDEDED